LSRILEKFSPPAESLIIDIGSNDSTILQAYPAKAFKCVGVDPTGKKFKQFYPRHIQLISGPFSVEVPRKHIRDKRAAWSGPYFDRT